LYLIDRVVLSEVSSILNPQTKRTLTGQKMAKLLSQNLKRLFEENHVDFAFLGGSWANDKQNWWSDIDVFVSFPKFLEFSSGTQLDFITLLHVKATDLTNFEEIEISILETLPLHVQFNVIENGILLYEKNPEITHLFIEKMLPLYYDHIIWYKTLLNQSKYI